MHGYKKRIGKFLAEFVFSLRKKRNLSQEKMAEYLHISRRAYSDLEKGKHCFSAVSLLFLLLMLTEGERRVLLERLREIILTLEQREIA